MVATIIIEDKKWFWTIYFRIGFFIYIYSIEGGLSIVKSKISIDFVLEEGYNETIYLRP